MDYGSGLGELSNDLFQVHWKQVAIKNQQSAEWGWLQPVRLEGIGQGLGIKTTNIILHIDSSRIPDFGRDSSEVFSRI